MSEKKSKSATSRTRNYACVVYPESAPENWQTIISESKVPVFISPYHDKDINADGTPKKPHYHVQTMYDAPKTREQATEFFQSFGGVGCEVIGSTRAYARYLCHLDNPEKVQYNVDDVVAYGGADYRHTIGTASDIQKAIREMMAYIEENDMTSWSDLALYAAENRSDWFDALTRSASYFTKEYIKSRTWKLHHTEEK